MFDAPAAPRSRPSAALSGRAAFKAVCRTVRVRSYEGGVLRKALRMRSSEGGVLRKAL